jgi:putative DNA primase/helicase
LATGSSIQIHPDTPYVGSNGKPQKWVTPVGDTSGFSAFEALSTEYVIVTEGIVKVMSLYQLGHNSLSLNGVDNWSSPRESKTEPRKIKPGLLRHLPPTVYLAFDMDWHSNPNVLRALKAFAEALILTGRTVKVLIWDPKLKGIDDYLATLDIESRCIALEQMIESAPEFNQFLMDLERAETAGMLELPKNMSPEKLFHDLMLAEIKSKVIVPHEHQRSRNTVGYVWDTPKFCFVPYHLETELVSRIAPFLDSLYQKQAKKDFHQNAHVRSCLGSIDLIARTLSLGPKTVVDDDVNLIRFNNGVYNLRDNTMTKDTKYLSISAGYATCISPTPNFDAWVASSFSGIDKSLILAVMRFLIDPKPRHEKLVHVYGPSGSGKGVFCRLMTKLLGQHHVSHGSLDGLSHPDKIKQALRNSRLLIDSDHVGLLNDPTLIYKIVSNESLDVRALYESVSTSESKPRRILIASIEPLNIKASTGGEGGWIRRCFPLKTNCAVRVEGIEDRIYGELGGIMSQILSVPIETAIALMDKYEADNVTSLDKAAESPLVTFINAHVVPSPGATQIRPGKLYDIYKIWSTFRGIKPMSLSTFNRRLADKGLRPKVEGKYYVDVDWIDEALNRMASALTTDAYDPTNYSDD